MDKQNILQQLAYTLIASCQPVENGPMDSVESIVQMARACVAGGAGGVRIQGVENVRAVAQVLGHPVVGIVKRDLPGTDVRITPYLEDVRGLAEAGAQIIAYDATLRERPVSTQELVAAIKGAGCIAMADCATLEEGILAAETGVELIGTTLSGYTGGPIPKEPDFKLLQDLAARGYKVVAEGRFNQPDLAGAAIRAGAYCVTVGSAITRVEHICEWFSEAIHQAAK